MHAAKPYVQNNEQANSSHIVLLKEQQQIQPL